MPQVKLSTSEIFNLLCSDCKDKIVARIKEKLTDQAIRQQLEKPPASAEEEDKNCPEK